MPEVLLYWIIFINEGCQELMMIGSWKRIRSWQQLHCCCHVSTGSINCTGAYHFTDAGLMLVCQSECTEHDNDRRMCQFIIHSTSHSEQCNFSALYRLPIKRGT